MYLFMHSGVIEHSFHITCCSIPLTVTQWPRLVDQEHVHSSVAPDLTPVLVMILFLNLCFLVSILLIIVCCFVPFSVCHCIVCYSSIWGLPLVSSNFS